MVHPYGEVMPLGSCSGVALIRRQSAVESLACDHCTFDRTRSYRISNPAQVTSSLCISYYATTSFLVETNITLMSENSR